VIAVCGAVVSTVQPCEAGVLSTLPAASIARTRKLWAPGAKPVYAWGELQAANAPSSSEHWKVEPGSLAVKLKLALVLEVCAGGDAVIVVSGADVSTVHPCEAGVLSALPAASIARTAKECVPGPRPV
jgi:hypothetical protein